MRKVVLAGCVLVCGLTGCAAVPPLDNPVLIQPTTEDSVENPVIVAPGLPTPEAYQQVYEKVLDALDDYFVIKAGSRYPGEIETMPAIAPGYEQPWKGGSRDPRERLLATFQSMRHYAKVSIKAGERGGFRVYVEVYKQLEDVVRPSQQRSGPSGFRESPTVDRTVSVVSVEAPADKAWIPAGRDHAFEQTLLRKIQRKCRE